MATSADRWGRLRDLFDRATELPTGQRHSFVDQASADDPELRAELKAMLEADQCQKKRPITDAVGTFVESVAADRRQRLVGSIVSNYRLVALIGHGGVGTVYRAEAVDSELAAPIAIKIVERAAFDPVSRRRFQDEKQILATLVHVNIARMFDAGETKEGYPYLAMEYVEGEPIDKYCDRRRLDIKDRIRLFLLVCDAVQHAHRNLVLHRDIKPSNILITPEGVPKLLDFGLAKLIDSQTRSVESSTRFQDQLLTPEYASPEQLSGAPLTTASDVYALGVLLFELLTGLRPIKFVASSRLQIGQEVFQRETPMASKAVSQAYQAEASAKTIPTDNIRALAARRRTEPSRLRQGLKGDLDAILTNALRGSPTERYPCVEEFAADIRRHLNFEPVVAAQGHAIYRSKRFLRRHAATFSMAAAMIGTLCVSIVLVSKQIEVFSSDRDHAHRERLAAESITEFMNSVFTASPDRETPDTPVLARELLDMASARIETVAVQPYVKARLLQSIGRSYHYLGESEPAVRFQLSSLAILRTLPNDNPMILANALRSLSQAQLLSGELAAARLTLIEGKTVLDRAGLTDTAEFAALLVTQGRVHYAMGNAEASRLSLADALPILKRVYGPRHSEVASALVELGNSYLWMGDLRSMESVVREAVSIYRDSLPPLHPDRLLAQLQLGECFLYQRKIDEAAPLIEANVEARRRLFGARGMRFSEDLYTLVQLQRAQGRLSDAEQSAQNAVQGLLQQLGPRNSRTAFAQVTLASVLWQQERFAEAERLLRTALIVYRKAANTPAAFIASAEYFLAESLLGMNRPAEALQLAESGMQLLRDKHPLPWRIARLENLMGQVFFQTGNTTEAREYLERSYMVIARSNDVDTVTWDLARSRLENFYIATGKTAKLAELRSGTEKTYTKSAKSAANGP